MILAPGLRLGRYQIVDEISRGGMGVVYRAVDVTLDREVALKVLPADLVSHPDRRERFIQEARAASALEHPHIAVIHEVGEDQGLSFIAMELIRGEKLADLIASNPLQPARALELGIEIAEALARAHEKGVVHRDLKPANVMVTDEGHAKLIDFGLAKLIGPLAGDAMETVAGGTDPGTVLGTVSYMSPEQARGGRVDHRTDIFSFGILLHEMLAGRPPFRGPSGVETLHSIMNATPPPLPPLGANVSADAAVEIQRIRDKCLEKSPDDRYQGMRDVVVDLRGARRRLESAVIVPTATARSARRWWWAPVAALIAIAAAGTATVFWPAAPAPAAAKPSLAVMYFENNTGNAELDWLRTGLTDMLVTDLSQSPNIEVLGTDRLQQILAELRRADDRTVSFDVVQQLARRAGVKTVLVGSYVKSGDAIRINVRLQDASDGRIVAAERVDAAGEAHLFPTMDDLTRRIRAKLEVRGPAGESIPLLSRPATSAPETPDGADRDLRDVTTASIEAYRYYAEGVNLHERFREAESVPLFEKALAIDPSFALAMTKLAVVHRNLNHPAESVEYARRAYEHIDRVSLRERYYIEGEHFSNRQDTLAKAIAAYEQGLKLYPDHASIRNNLALAYLQLDRRDEAIAHYEELRRRGMSFPGSYETLAYLYTDRGEFDRGVQVLEEYLQRHPDVALAHGALGHVLIVPGKLDDALAAFTRAEALEPGATLAANGRWFVHVLREEWTDAAAIAARLITSADTFRRHLGHMQTAWLDLYRGRSTAALAALDRATRAYASPAGPTAQARARSAYVLVARDDGAAALAQATRARAEAGSTPVQGLAMQVLALAQFDSGRPADAEKTLQELRGLAAQLPGEREIRRVHHLAGQLALRRRDYTAAVRELTAAADRLPPRSVNRQTFAPAAQIWFDLGSAYLAAGRANEAESWLRRLVESTSERVAAPMEYVRALYLLATIYEKRGEVEQARTFYRRFLDHWRDGDLDRERVVDAERRLRTGATH